MLASRFTHHLDSIPELQAANPAALVVLTLIDEANFTHALVVGGHFAGATHIPRASAEAAALAIGADPAPFDVSHLNGHRDAALESELRHCAADVAVEHLCVSDGLAEAIRCGAEWDTTPTWLREEFAALLEV